jgi:hypothetical protein
MHSRPCLDRRLLAALTLASVLVLPAVASASPWMPLAEGTLWEYLGVGGLHQTQVINGTTTLFGRTLAVKNYIEGGDAGLQNFWMTGPDGSVLLGGFNNVGAGFALAYDPPIVMLAAAPTLGMTWSTHAMAYTMPSMTEYGPIDIVWEVFEDVVLDVPLGSYPAFGVGQAPPVAAPVITVAAHGTMPTRTFTLDGRLVDATGKAAGDGVATVSNATDWYSGGIGVVQYRTDDLYQLFAFAPPLPAASSTWGSIKRRFR